MNDLTLIEKIQREQEQTAADLQWFLESERSIGQADLEAIRANELKNLDLIREIAEKANDTEK